MGTWSYYTISAEAAGSDVTSLTVTLPTSGNVMAAGDGMILVARGYNADNTGLVTPPSGWTELGTHGGVWFLGAWYKTHGASESNPTIQIAPGSDTFTRAHVIGYRGAGDFAVVAPCVDEVSGFGTDFQPGPLVTTQDATVICLVSCVSNTGTLSVLDFAGFTSRQAPTTNPKSRFFDKNVSAGTITQPSVHNRPIGSIFLSKRFGIERLLAAGWSVGQIKF